jgi:hypothetical protein
MGSAQQFPAFEIWQQMEEGEQDALLSRLETAQRRKTMAGRTLLVFGCALAVVAVAYYLGLLV